MPRRARLKSRSGIYHVMIRGVNRQIIFKDDEDKGRLVWTLRKYKPISKYQIFSYCLMNNHIHLLMKESEEGLSEAIKRISSSYVYWYNTKYNRIGHLFQDRYKSENVEDRAYFLTVLRYIHQNPMKAGLASDVFESTWTSANQYIHPDTLVDIDFGLNLFSSDRSEAITMYKDFMQQSNDDQCLEDMVKIRITDDEVMAHLRQLGVNNGNILRQMKKNDRDAILEELRRLNHVSLSQIARVTGISKSVIQRLR
ncbi:transposase [Niallia oryzisoli]|uniref:Transposase n=1 Tax=Niallia oryzisoli TaxID=1737571 RepID=A0ABZ2CB72_9BACI